MIQLREQAIAGQAVVSTLMINSAPGIQVARRLAPALQRYGYVTVGLGLFRKSKRVCRLCLYACGGAGVVYGDAVE